MTLISVDTSAWHHTANAAVTDRWTSALGDDSIGICDQVRLEILYSARSASDYDAIATELDGLRVVPQDAATSARALEVQRLLSLEGGLHHRSVKIADLMIAAAAERVGAVVWHYDADFDRIAAVTGQATEWIAPRGSL